MSLLTSAMAAGREARRRGHALSQALSHPAAPLVMAGLWFVLTFTATIWVWGLNPVALISPDEAVNRFGASLISKHGLPFLRLPFPDPEDLAHPRHWVSLGDHAIPAYSPVALYFYGLLLRFHTFGLGLIVALPASATAAFVAGLAKLLPTRRRWLSLLAPLLAFPALYWLMRPWMNLSLLLVCVCWAFYYWVSWQETGGRRDLTVALFGVGAAAAVRPDYAAYLMLAALLFALGSKPAEWKRIALLVVAAGGAAVALNLLLNRLTTGSALRAAYQIVAARDEGNDVPRGAFGLLRQLLLPMGVPTPKAILEFFIKYWFTMGPLGAVVLAQLALVPLLRAKPLLSRLCYVFGILVLVCFMISRMDDQLMGADQRVGQIHHSMPRYWTPVYLLAALPPILFLGRCQNRWLLGLGVALACSVSSLSGYELVTRQPSSLVKLRAYSNRYEELIHGPLSNEIPGDAWVYSATFDKILWSRWRVATFDQPDRTAASMNRAVNARLNVFLCEPKISRARLHALTRALLSHQLALVAVDPSTGVYYVQRTAH